MKSSALIVWLATIVSHVNADCYLHNPRGSNNRLDEANRDRNNGNRMFDSQNNNRGGYNVGSLYYYEGSVLNVEWTNQHSCDGPNNHCDLIMQYMCGDLVRDGTTTTTIPDNPVNCQDYNCNTDMRYGMHESYNYYLNCRGRKRNMGLFTADRKLNGNSARFTRQNPGGTRRGYECSEERDYYPYWHPTPWKDVAILTSDPSRCPYYEEESENVKPRYSCQVPAGLYSKNSRIRREAYIPNNQEECEQVQWPEARDIPRGANVSVEYGQWVQTPSHGLPKPICRQTRYSRDNHLGNSFGGFPLMMNWTVPRIKHEHCVFRIRYNISTAEYDGWDSAINASLNKRPGKNYANLDVATKYGLQPNNEDGRGYVFKQNPTVEIFDEFPTSTPNAADKDFALRLAINTNQFGRTFQDRSHTFAVRERPEDLDCSTIHNLNVRGKRGNIVQVYPGVEYDMVPNRLYVAADDCIHFQWTGSNTNPNNNDGQGRAGTDRSNIVMLEPQRYPEGSGIAVASGNKLGHWGNSYPEHLNNSDTRFLGFSKTDLDRLSGLTHSQFRGELSELDDSGTYFDLGPKKVTGVGEYHYLCTRNNNFSNRSQKGKIYVERQATRWNQIDWNGGDLEIGDSTVHFDRGVRNTPQDMAMEVWKTNDCEDLIGSLGKPLPSGSSAGDCVALYPQDQLVQNSTKKFQVSMPVPEGVTESVSIWRTTTAAASQWTLIEADVSDGQASFQATEGGVYMPRKKIKVAAVVGIACAVSVVLIIFIGTTIYFCKYPEKWKAVKNSVRQKASYAKRSFQSQV